MFSCLNHQVVLLDPWGVRETPYGNNRLKQFCHDAGDWAWLGGESRSGHSQVFLPGCEWFFSCVLGKSKIPSRQRQLTEHINHAASRRSISRNDRLDEPTLYFSPALDAHCATVLLWCPRSTAHLRRAASGEVVSTNLDSRGVGQLTCTSFCVAHK